VIDACLAARRSRLLVGTATAPAGVVHLRDAYLARRRGADVTAGRLAYAIPVLPAGTSVSDAVARLRAARSQLALVRTADDTTAGLVSLDALLSTLLVSG
jgi:CBS domain containing-hemolysin-like protein